MSIITKDEIDKCFRAISTSDMLVVDTETSGLSWQKNHVVGYVFTVGPRPEETWYLPVRHFGGGNIEGCSVPSRSDGWAGDIHWIERRIAQEVAPRKDLLVVGHNLKFDLHMFANHGIIFQGTTECTQVNAALIDENQGAFDLDTCASVMGLKISKDSSVYDTIRAVARGLGIDCPEGRKAMEYFWLLSATQAKNYASLDGTITFNLHTNQHVEMALQELERIHSVEKRVTKTLFRTERRGVPVDMEVVDKIAGQAEKIKEVSQKKFPKDFNPQSPKQVKCYLESNGVTNWPHTPKGAPSFPESFLETFDLGENIITYRKVKNLENTFINSSIRSHYYKGKIHTTLNQVAMDDYGTVTGRLSSSDPNLQQIPKRNKVLAPLLRQAYRSPDPNVMWGSADFKSQEYRVFAQYAKAKFIIDAYDKDPTADYHQLVADLLGVERDPTAKRINLGTIYGMGKAKLARTLNCSEAQADVYLKRMHQMMPEAKGFMREAERRARQSGFVKTLLGRRRHFPLGQDGAHKAGNSVIQGSCADITKLKMVEIDEYLDSINCRTQMILQVHDSLEFLVPMDEKEVFDECMRIMQSFGPNDAISLRVPMLVDIGMGRSWGHATFPKYKEWL